MRRRFPLLVASATIPLLLLAVGCSRGVSNCQRNASDSWSQTGRSLQSWDLVGAAVDVAMLPVRTATDCARDMAVSPLQEWQAANVQRSVKAVRVSPEEAAARQRPATPPAAPSAATVAAPAPAPATAPAALPPDQSKDPCGYRSGCVAASTLVIEGGRRADLSGQIIQEHAQYEITNQCGEPVLCWLCGTRAGKVMRGESATCDDGATSRLDVGETWISRGDAQGIDGMSLTCLKHAASDVPASCRTWPQ
ncbi:MAG: hypothetical protein HYY35_03800 [Deltaproteobacteria bacterium]|nr:hypothetical protein [Deltaproteobacteria bacterium]